jgi:transcription elongation factor B subunit 1
MTLLKEWIMVFRGIVTEKLVEYMCFKSHYQNVGPKEDIPVQEMQERIPPEIVLEVCVLPY